MLSVDWNDLVRFEKRESEKRMVRYHPALVPQFYQWGIVERIERGLG